VFFGLMVLDFVSFARVKLPGFNKAGVKYPAGILGAVIFGFF